MKPHWHVILEESLLKLSLAFLHAGHASWSASWDVHWVRLMCSWMTGTSNIIVVWVVTMIQVLLLLCEGLIHAELRLALRIMRASLILGGSTTINKNSKKHLRKWVHLLDSFEVAYSFHHTGVNENFLISVVKTVYVIPLEVKSCRPPVVLFEIRCELLVHLLICPCLYRRRVPPIMLTLSQSIVLVVVHYEIVLK